MDFVTGLPKTNKQHDSAWIVIDRLTKSAHFLPVKTSYTADQHADIYIQEIVRLHGIPKTISVRWRISIYVKILEKLTASYRYLIKP